MQNTAVLSMKLRVRSFIILLYGGFITNTSGRIVAVKLCYLRFPHVFVTVILNKTQITNYQGGNLIFYVLKSRLKK